MLKMLKIWLSQPKSASQPKRLPTPSLKDSSPSNPNQGFESEIFRTWARESFLKKPKWFESFESESRIRSFTTVEYPSGEYSACLKTQA